MRSNVILDTGPLVAYLKKTDRFHGWACEELAKVKPPLLTCEAVIVEACFLLRNTYMGADTVLRLLATEQMQIRFGLGEAVESVRELLARYQSVPMSITDVCLVRMVEQHQGSSIMTLDSDFLIYRRNKTQAISVIMPEQI